MDDCSSLLVCPARITPSRSEGELKEIQSRSTSADEVKPVKVLIYSSDGVYDRPRSGPNIHRVVTACGGYGYGKLPFMATCLMNGHHDLSGSVVDARERERRQMQDLNEKFAEYIEKVRFLEAQNKRLSNELDNLKHRWGRETKKVKVMYEMELSDARKKFNDLDREKAALEIKVTSLEEQLAETLKRTHDLEFALKEEREVTMNSLHRAADLESQSGYLKKKLSEFEVEKERDLEKVSRLIQQLNKLRSDLDDETLLHIHAENRRQTLEEQMNFMKMIHDQEMKELAGLVCRDSTAENREYWRGEIEKALKEIVELFEDQMRNFKDDVETSYDLKIREYVSGANKQNLQNVNEKDQSSSQMKDYLNELNKKLLETEGRNQLLIKEIEALRRQRDGLSLDQGDEVNRVTLENIRLKSELNSLMNELHSTIDDKLALERELMDYKKIVEQTPAGSKQVYEHNISIVSEEQKSRRPQVNHVTDISSEKVVMDVRSAVKGEMSSKVRVQKSSRGNVSIADSAEDGSLVAIENFGNQEENLHGWYLERKVDSFPPSRFYFDETIIRPGVKIKIWSSDKKPDAMDENDLVFEGGSWSGGRENTTILYNPHNEEKATYVQKTKYS